MKIDWNMAPAWANYAAQDADGDWYWYESKPYLEPGAHDWDIFHAGDRLASFSVDHAPTHADSLQERSESEEREGDRRQERPDPECEEDRGQEQFDVAVQLLSAMVRRDETPEVCTWDDMTRRSDWLVAAAWHMAHQLIELRGQEQ